MAFGQMLATNLALQVVDMRMNQLGDAGGKILAEALGANQTIKNIHIEGRMSGPMVMPTPTPTPAEPADSPHFMSLRPAPPLCLKSAARVAEDPKRRVLWLSAVPGGERKFGEKLWEEG